MPNIISPQPDTLKVELVKRPVIMEDYPTMVVRMREGRVILIIDDKAVNMNTVTAHKIGLALGTTQVPPDAMLRLSVNGETVDLPDPIDKRLCAGLLRKADAADDWQRQHSTNRRLIQ